jgi:archaellum component FlaC
MLVGAEKLAEKVPGWVERLLIPTLESRVRAIVKEELGHLEKTMNARFEGIEARFGGVDARFDGVEAKLDAVNTRIDSLEKRMKLVEDIADIKARLAIVEKRTAA